MIIGSVSENINIEKRVAITPDIIKKYKSLGLEIHLSKNYALHLGITDNEYETEGAKIKDDKIEIISKSDAIVQMNILEDNFLNKLKQNQILIGVLNPYSNDEKLKGISSKNVNCFSLELLPRITRAQSMDILSSQANLAGYKAVVDSFAFSKSYTDDDDNSWYNFSCESTMVGAGVAGLQYIATAKRMGAIVFATDVRLASKEQVESLGGKISNC